MLSGTTWPWKCIPYHFLNLWYRYNSLYFKEPVKHSLAFKVINVTERIKVNQNYNFNLPHMTTMWGKKQNRFPKRKTWQNSYKLKLLYLPKIKNWGRHFLDNGLTLSENFYQLKKVFRSKQLLLTNFSPIIPSIEHI